MHDRGTLVDYLLVLLSAVLWGSAGVLVRRIGLQGQETVITFWRMVLGAGFTLAVISVSRRLQSLRPGPHPLLLALSGVLLSFHWTFYFKSIHMLPVSTAVFIAYLAPVLVALTAPLFLGERMERRTPAALALALGGVALLSWGGGGGNTSPFSWAGLAFALLTAFSYAALVLMLKELRRDTDTLTITFYQSAIGALTVAPLMPFQTYHISTSGKAYLGFLGVVLTGVTGLLYVHAARRVKAQHLGIISYVEPLSAVLYGWFLLGETPGWRSMAGGVLIIAAGVLAFTGPVGAPPPEDEIAPKTR